MRQHQQQQQQQGLLVVGCREHSPRPQPVQICSPPGSFSHHYSSISPYLYFKCPNKSRPRSAVEGVRTVGAPHPGWVLPTWHQSGQPLCYLLHGTFSPSIFARTILILTKPGLNRNTHTHTSTYVQGRAPFSN